jgi:arsenical pump membrane protein
LFEVIVLGLSAVLMLARPFGIPYWSGPVFGVVIALGATVVSVDDAWSSVSPLREPLLFLVFAVPLAVTLDDLGVFHALTATIDGGRHLIASLWVFAAGVVIVFNLDAAVVLLTPLYIRVAQRHGYPPEALAFQPALLACLASGLLPVSNLTNLIVAEQLDLGIEDFVRHMALPTVVACTIGYLAYQRTFSLPARPALIREPIDHRALRVGLPIVGFVLVGFTIGDVAGVPAWVIAAIATTWASACTRTVRWRAVPVAAIGVAASLAVLVAAALPFLRLDTIFDRPGESGRLAALVYGVVGSNVTNNLPAVLAGTPSIVSSDQTWPLLIGTNLGPVLVLTASLSSLLWKDTAERLGVDISAARYSAVGARVGLPALVAAAIAVVAVP